MPTLLSINNYFYRRGGAEVVCLEQNRLFQDIGWQVVPFAMHHPKNDASPWSDYFVDEIEFGHDYSLLRKASSAAKITFSFEARRKIAALAAAVMPDVAHAHNVYHHISPAIFGKLKSLGVPTVLTLHDLKIACPAYKMLASDGICERCKGGAIWNVARHRCVKDSLVLSTVVMVESAVNKMLGSYSRHVDRFVVPSRFYIDKLVEWGWPRDRFVHVPNFVDVDSHRASFDAGEGFLYVGRLGNEKGIATFIRAAALAGVKALIVGTGPAEASLRAVAASTGGDVQFFGYQSGGALHDVFRAARAVVLPSEWYENAPMSVLEAYALGRPVIGARIGGIPELVQDGQTGSSFESGSVDCLAEQLRKLADATPSTLAAMGRAGRAWVERDFTAQRYRDRLRDLYASMGVAA